MTECLQAQQLNKEEQQVMQSSATQIMTQIDQSKALQGNVQMRQLRESTCVQVVKHEPQAVHRGNNDWLVISPL